MTVSNGLKDLAKKLQENADSIIAESEHNPSLFNYVIETIAAASHTLEKAASDLDGKEPVNTNEILETIAGLAQSLDETGDDILVKKASLLDELLITISAPKSAMAQSQAKSEDEINKLRAKYRSETIEKKYNGNADKLDEQAKKAEIAKAFKDQVKEYRPLEAPLMTRYCPDHPGAGVIRIADRTYQCSLDKKIYNWEAGFTTVKGNKIPGGGVEYQNKDWGVRGEGHTVFDSRESVMSRYASVKMAQFPQELAAIEMMRSDGPYYFETKQSADDYIAEGNLEGAESVFWPAEGTDLENELYGWLVSVGPGEYFDEASLLWREDELPEIEGLAAVASYKQAQVSNFKLDKANKKIIVPATPGMTDQQKQQAKDNITSSYGNTYADYEVVFDDQVK